MSDNTYEDRTERVGAAVTAAEKQAMEEMATQLDMSVAAYLRFAHQCLAADNTSILNDTYATQLDQWLDQRQQALTDKAAFFKRDLKSLAENRFEDGVEPELFEEKVEQMVADVERAHDAGLISDDLLDKRRDFARKAIKEYKQRYQDPSIQTIDEETFLGSNPRVYHAGEYETHVEEAIDAYLDGYDMKARQIAAQATDVAADGVTTDDVYEEVVEQAYEGELEAAAEAVNGGASFSTALRMVLKVAPDDLDRATVERELKAKAKVLRTGVEGNDDTMPERPSKAAADPSPVTVSATDGGTDPEGDPDE